MPRSAPLITDVTQPSVDHRRQHRANEARAADVADAASLSCRFSPLYREPPVGHEGATISTAAIGHEPRTSSGNTVRGGVLVPGRRSACLQVDAGPHEQPANHAINRAGMPATLMPGGMVSHDAPAGASDAERTGGGVARPSLVRHQNSLTKRSSPEVRL